MYSQKTWLETPIDCRDLQPSGLESLEDRLVIDQMVLKTLSLMNTELLPTHHIHRAILYRDLFLEDWGFITF
jgi:hypothetical protein